MKSKYFYVALLALTSHTVFAQETYENAPLANEDLNGTARYVGMGGAMDALGADISTIGSNPAGIGLFRKSMVNGSLGFISQQSVKSFNGANKTNVSFDQIGFVYAMRNSGNSFVNFAFNYHKGRNFNEILNVADKFSQYIVNGKSRYISSQNKAVYQKIKNEVFKTSKDYTYSYLDDLYLNDEGGRINIIKDANNQDSYIYYPATDYTFDRNSTGYIGNYDFNISGNINDRVYLGLTFGIKDVHYKRYSEYTEIMDTNIDGLKTLGLVNEREITGTGFDIKAGIIFRPVEASPFRIGISVTTPTWYDLTATGKAILNYEMLPSSSYKGGSNGISLGAYDFKFYTPWKFGVSLGHTVGNYLALGASYEYADYSGSDIRVNDGYDYYGYVTSSSDAAMKRNIKEVLRGVSTVKLGLEYKPAAAWAVRLGYNYVSPMYNKNGVKNVANNKYIASPGHVLTTSTDYTNWKATNRFTCGLGYNIGRFSLDLAYQYAVTKGEFNPFNSYTDGPITNTGDTALEGDNLANIINVNDKRHQLLFTLGYKF